MAYLPMSQVERERRQGGRPYGDQQGNPTSPPAGGGAPAPAPAPAEPTSYVAGTPSGGQTTPGFFNYITANQGAGQAMTDRLAGEVGRSGQEAETALGAANTEFTNKLETERQRAKKAGLQPDVTAPAPTPSTERDNDGRPRTPAAPVRPDAALDYQYKGPGSITELDSYGRAVDLTRQAGQDIGLAQQVAGKDVGGLQTLLERTYGPVSAGNARLDSALIGSKLQDQAGALRDQYGKLPGQLTSAVKTSEEASGALRGRIEKSQGDIAKAYEDALNRWNTPAAPAPTTPLAPTPAAPDTSWQDHDWYDSEGHRHRAGENPNLVLKPGVTWTPAKYGPNHG